MDELMEWTGNFKMHVLVAWFARGILPKKITNKKIRADLPAGKKMIPIVQWGSHALRWVGAPLTHLWLIARCS